MLPLWDTLARRRRAGLTGWLVAANVAVFLWEVVLAAQGGEAAGHFIDRYALIPARWFAHWHDPEQSLTLITHAFLHGGWLHLAGNVWFLWVFGRSVEGKLGWFRYGCLYVLAGGIAAFAQMILSPHSEVPMVGASGAISGVLGAYFMLFPRAWIVALVPWFVPILPVPAFVFLLLWFVVQTMSGLGSLLGGDVGEGGVAWWAHAGGFLGGVVLVRRLKGRR